tara:strand:+ start:353 stop:778 length:426 start_codon:yes stop_codon:yes gene_type:complete
VFKNGKRAKAPFCIMEGKDTEEVEKNFFDTHDLEGVTKNNKHSWTFVRSDMSQEREEEKEDLEQKTYISKRNRIFTKYLKRNDEKHTPNIVGGLILCKQSDWKWQWAFMEMSTSRYLSGFSPLFKSYENANSWMQKEIDNL